MLYEPLCKRCNQPGKIICFCTNAVICESCIGLHLIEDPELPHKPIAITHNNYKHSSRNNSLTPEEQEFLTETYLKQEQSQEIKAKITREIQHLEEFKTSSLKAISEFVKLGEKMLKEAMNQATDNVVSACDNVRRELTQALAKMNSGKEHPVLSALVGKGELQGLSLVTKSFQINQTQLWTNLSALTSVSVLLALPSKSPPIRNYSVDVIDEEEPMPMERTFSGKSPIKKPQLSKLKAFSMPPVKTGEKAQKPVLYYLNTQTNEVSSYDICNDSVNSFPLKREKVAEHSAWSVTADGRIIITGGLDGIALRRTVSLNISSKEVKRLENMAISRHSHAQVIMGNFLYVVGGYYNTPLKQCEKMHIGSGKWRKISNLSIARYGHGACVYNGRIFVVGGEGVDTIETLNPVSDKFSLLRLRVSPTPCVLFCESDKILVLQDDKLRALITSGTASYVVGDIPSHKWHSRTESLSFGDRTFFLVNSQVFTYSGVSHAIEPLFTFTN